MFRWSTGEGNGNPLQCSCLENPMDRGTWWATVHGVTKRWTWLSDWAQHTHSHLAVQLFPRSIRLQLPLYSYTEWMASLTRWTWVWVNSGSWWWTGRPGVLRFMGSQRVGHDWETELNWKVKGSAIQITFCICFLSLSDIFCGLLHTTCKGDYQLPNTMAGLSQA